eukprot:scaffold24_cov245-Pinguiococcus_pyrenoidosus.AAC.4
MLRSGASGVRDVRELHITVRIESSPGTRSKKHARFACSQQFASSLQFACSQQFACSLRFCLLATICFLATTVYFLATVCFRATVCFLATDPVLNWRTPTLQPKKPSRRMVQKRPPPLSASHISKNSQRSTSSSSISIMTWRSGSVRTRMFVLGVYRISCGMPTLPKRS